ncbi:MAG: chemotaxis protein CheW [Deltaproteobacteria bacterium]|jgi:chemotaxis signal transduction protein|nr:chemotaxis protein CheW [Deltaproteobacteria bacterium]
MECFIFEAAEKYLGIEAQYIYRVADDVAPTPVPLTPPCHVGIIYYRGDLFDVIDMGRLLGDERSPSNGHPYVILLKWGQRKLGLIPYRIVGMEWIEDSDSTQIVITKDGRTIQMITLEEIWEILSELPYGH